MADITALRELDAAIKYADARAVQGLADYMRDAVSYLPDESRLGLVFMRFADSFETWARDRNSGGSGMHLTLVRLDKELDRLEDEDEGA
jgi:hypothetical protein